MRLTPARAYETQRISEWWKNGFRDHTSMCTDDGECLRVGQRGALALRILKHVTGGSLGGLLSVALTSLQAPKLLLFPLEPNQSPQLCQWRPGLILRTTASVLEMGRAGVLDALQKQLLRGVL